MSCLRRWSLRCLRWSLTPIAFQLSLAGTALSPVDLWVRFSKWYGFVVAKENQEVSKKKLAPPSPQAKPKGASGGGAGPPPAGELLQGVGLLRGVLLRHRASTTSRGPVRRGKTAAFRILKMWVESHATRAARRNLRATLAEASTTLRTSALKCDRR
jgi:hypothetical protein